MYPDIITSLHFELSDKCQASCPMCPRNSFGGAEREHIKNVEITLEQFKQWFPVDFLKQLRHVYACGNNGDPLMAKDCLEIFEYLEKNTHPDCLLDIHTNGSLRNKDWWTRLAKVMGKRGRVIFAIDGWAGEHEIYRRGTNWEKIIENAKTYIAAGGRARSDTIVFAHNEDRIEDLEKYLLEIGFESVNLKPTFRFYGYENFPVKDRKGNFEYYLKPAIGPRWNNNLPKPNFVKLVDKNEYNKMLASADIDPGCWKGFNIYVNSQGHLYPCCWVGSCVDNSRYVEVQSNPEEIIRDRLAQSAYDIVDDIGMIDLNGTTIVDALRASKWNAELPKHFTTDPKLVCVKSCAKNFSKIIT